ALAPMDDEIEIHETGDDIEVADRIDAGRRPALLGWKDRLSVGAGHRPHRLGIFRRREQHPHMHAAELAVARQILPLQPDAAHARRQFLDMPYAHLAERDEL